jgi:glycosyltransferase involved in cell wall biosynthesis
MEPCR